MYQTANGGIFYNPGSREAIDLIVNGVREIVRNYDVDAIHFDDYSMLQLTVALIVPCTPQTAVENRWQPGEDRMSIPWCGKFMPQ